MRQTHLPTLLLAVSFAGTAPSGAQLTEELVRLRNTGYAQLENEAPVDAEATYRRMLELRPDEPLVHANLAIALLRQDDHEAALAAIDRALELGGDRADLLLNRAEILHWSPGGNEEALGDYRRAADAAPDDPEVQYALFRQAEILAGETAAANRRTAVERLRKLRPDNLVVLLLSGAEALEDGDRGRASDDYLRLRELIWQAQPIAERVIENLLDALEEDDLEQARRFAPRLRNVLVDTPGWHSSLAEVYTNIQGIPVERFVDEPPVENFGDPLPVRFQAFPLSTATTIDRALETADLDGDGRPDLARVAAQDTEDGGSERETPQLELRPSAAGFAPTRTMAKAVAGLLLAGDVDNDHRLDLVAAGDPLSIWQLDEEGGLTDASERFIGREIPVSAADLIDFDSDGDLDLAIAVADGGPDLLRNVSAGEVFEGPLAALGRQSLPPTEPRSYHHLQATDADRDGDTDLLLAHDDGVLWLDNLRQGQFAVHEPPPPAQSLLGRVLGRLRGDEPVAGLETNAPVRVVRTADFDHDGRPEFVLAGARTAILRRDVRGAVSAFPLTAESVALPDDATDVALVDADNDGRRDLAFVADGELRILLQTADSGPEALEFRLARVLGLPRNPMLAVVQAEDLDNDGDLDLAAAGEGGLYRLENLDGSNSNWLRVRLVGLTRGNQKNNVFGRGATIEVRAGRGYQYFEVDRPVTHIGLGSERRPDLLRVVWANGVPQNRLLPGANETIVEEQVLKGSCPFLYAWNGKEMAFVTDLLWGAPLGMPLADGIWNGYDPDELVRVDGAQPRDGFYDLRITEELWEAAYFDRVRLWVVDHAEEMDVASNLRIVPGQGHVGRPPDEVAASASVRPVVRAVDGRGRDVTNRVRARDEVYADGYERSAFQGHAARPWTFTFDLGDQPARPIRLWLDGWVFPADASLNLAIAERVERGELEMTMTRLEVESPAGGWQVLLDPMGFPAGKTKTMIVDTPPLPPGAQRLRIVTTRWLHWDRVAWSTDASGIDGERVVLKAQLEPTAAELSYRGFSTPTRPAPNGPHQFDYQSARSESPWLPFPGRYTRFGEVRELLTEVDDRLVVMGPGDEIRVLFDARDLPPPAPGFVRTVFLESYGWDKDADRNTWRADSNMPLPFGAMSGYPWPAGEHYPDTPDLNAYRRTWLTRTVEGQSLGAGHP